LKNDEIKGERNAQMMIQENPAEATGNDKFKLVNYEFNSSSNLHFKT
jgi:hypothetical protein